MHIKIPVQTKRNTLLSDQSLKVGQIFTVSTFIQFSEMDNVNINMEQSLNQTLVVVSTFYGHIIGVTCISSDSILSIYQFLWVSLFFFKSCKFNT